MFKTMDGVSVYDKQDVDGITDVINASVSQNTSDIANLKTGVHNLQEQSVDFTEISTRVTTLESNKADKSEVSSLVQDSIDNVITAKVNTIASDINHIVDNAVDDALEDYDDSNAVDTKINNAINNIPATDLSSYDTSAQVTQKINTAIANIPSGPTAMTTSEATAIIDNYF